MTKQAEIREGLTLLMSECYSKELSVCPKHTIFQPQKFLNKLFPYLHSQGVVIKAGRELPENPYKVMVGDVNKSYPNGIPKGYHILQEAGCNEGYDEAIKDMAGYIAVIPLIDD